MEDAAEFSKSSDDSARGQGLAAEAYALPTATHPAIGKLFKLEAKLGDAGDVKSRIRVLFALASHPDAAVRAQARPRALDAAAQAANSHNDIEVAMSFVMRAAVATPSETPALAAEARAYRNDQGEDGPAALSLLAEAMITSSPDAKTSLADDARKLLDGGGIGSTGDIAALGALLYASTSMEDLKDVWKRGTDIVDGDGRGDDSTAAFAQILRAAAAGLDRERALSPAELTKLSLGLGVRRD